MSSEMLLLFLSMIYSFIDKCDYSLCLYGSEIRLEPVLLLFFKSRTEIYIIPVLLLICLRSIFFHTIAHTQLCNYIMYYTLS